MPLKKLEEMQSENAESDAEEPRGPSSAVGKESKGQREGGQEEESKFSD